MGGNRVPREGHPRRGCEQFFNLMPKLRDPDKRVGPGALFTCQGDLSLLVSAAVTRCHSGLDRNQQSQRNRTEKRCFVRCLYMRFRAPGLSEIAVLDFSPSSPVPCCPAWEKCESIENREPIQPRDADRSRSGRWSPSGNDSPGSSIMSLIRQKLSTFLRSSFGFRLRPRCSLKAGVDDRFDLL